MRVGAIARIRGLVLKDVAELWRHPGAVLPAISMALGAIVPGFAVAIIAPILSGETFSNSDEFAVGARHAATALHEIARLEGAALVQAFLLHQFGLLLLLVPVIGSMALAAHAVIGEKVARTLEPLLATPLSTAELLAAKTVTPLAFSLAVMWTTVAVFVAGIAVVGQPGVWQTFLGPRTFILFGLVGPLLAVVALLLAVIISSRVNDPRSAQQLGALVVLPIVGVFLGQLFAQFMLDSTSLLLSALGLATLASVLLWVGIRVFDRERILMRWK
jgi:ABC-2 type transport system permease protein